MIRSFIALFVALFFALASIVAPAYADTTTLEDASQVKAAGFSMPYIEIKPENVQAFINEVVRNGGEVIGTVGSSIPSIKINPEYVDEFTKAAIGSSVSFGTPIVICYAADGLATTVFPPAVALLPFCSQMGIVTGIAGGGAQIVKQVVPMIIK